MLKKIGKIKKLRGDFLVWKARISVRLPARFLSLHHRYPFHHDNNTHSLPLSLQYDPKRRSGRLLHLPKLYCWASSDLPRSSWSGGTNPKRTSPDLARISALHFPPYQYRPLNLGHLWTLPQLHFRRLDGALAELRFRQSCCRLQRKYHLPRKHSRTKVADDGFCWISSNFVAPLADFDDAEIEMERQQISQVLSTPSAQRKRKI